MIAIQNIKLWESVDKFDTCSACDATSEEAKLFRIKTEQGVSVCFCEDCTQILLPNITAIVRGNAF